MVVGGLQPEEMAQKVRVGRKRKADDMYVLGFSNFLVMPISPFSALFVSTGISRLSSTIIKAWCQ